jgi:hypothetical protein
MATTDQIIRDLTVVYRAFLNARIGGFSGWLEEQRILPVLETAENYLQSNPTPSDQVIIADPDQIADNRAQNDNCLARIDTFLGNVPFDPGTRSVLEQAAIQLSRYNNTLDSLEAKAQPIKLIPTKEQQEIDYKVEQYDKLRRWYEDYVKEHGMAREYPDDLLNHIAGVIRKNNDNAARILSGIKDFATDMVIYLRAVSLTAESAARGGTHRQKAARLDVVLEAIESAIDKIRKHSFDFHDHFYWQYYPDVFRSEYPVREFMDRAHNAEAELAALKEKYEPAPSSEAQQPGEIPF